jgi:hypothetical protein
VIESNEERKSFRIQEDDDELEEVSNFSEITFTDIPKAFEYNNRKLDKTNRALN